MKACIVGKAPIDFTIESTGEVIEGVKLYFFSPKDNIDGFFAGDMWVKKSSKLYPKVLNFNTDKPFMADLDYENQPSKKGVVSVLTDIRILDLEELSKLLDNPNWQDYIATIN